LRLHAVFDGAAELHAPLVFNLAAGLGVQLELGVVDMAGHLASPKAEGLETPACGGRMTV